MLSIETKSRTQTGRANDSLRQEGITPAVLYGPGLENKNLGVDTKEFIKLFRQAGKSSLFSLVIDGKEKFMVLVGDIAMDPVSGKLSHIDFYQPNLNEEIEADVPVLFVGESPAQKLGCTLVKNISEITVKALPADLPREINVDISKLANADDTILVKDLPVGEKVKILKNAEEIVVMVAEVQKIDEELEKSIEEGEAPVKIEKEKKEKDETGKEE